MFQCRNIETPEMQDEAKFVLLLSYLVKAEELLKELKQQSKLIEWHYPLGKTFYEFEMTNF